MMMVVVVITVTMTTTTTTIMMIKTRYLQIQSQNVPLQKASVLRTFTVRSTRVLGKTDSFLYI